MGDEIEIDSYIIIPHEQILSQPDVDEAELIRKTLKKFVEQNPVIKDPIVISVPGHRSFARFSKLPPVEPKKIPDIVHYEATQQIPFGIDEVVWDYHIFQAEGSPEVEVGIFAIKRSIISQYLGYFHELNLHPISVQKAPVALYNAYCFEGLLGKEATVIADVGAQNTNFLVAEDHRLWLRNIPLGGNNFTESLQKSFKLNFAKAEELKCTAATSKYARAVFQAMRPVFSDLSAEFQRSIGFYTSVNRESQVTQLYALGSAFRLPGLLKFLQQNLNMSVQKLETFGKARLGNGINEADFSENVLTLAVSYGLVLQGMGLAKVKTDLMPPEIARQVTWKKKNYWFIAAAACLLLATGAVWLRYMSDSSAIQADMDKNLSSIKQKTEPYDKLRSEYQQLSSQNKSEDQLVGDFQKMSDNRLLQPRLMAILTSAVPTQKEFVEAKTPQEYKKIAEGIKRSQRTQIFVDQVKMTYLPDLTEQKLTELEKAGRTATLKSISGSDSSGGMGGMGGMMGGPWGGGQGGMNPGMMGGPPPGMMGPGGPEGMGGPPSMMGQGMGRRGGSGGGSGGGLHRGGSSRGTGSEDGNANGNKALVLTIVGTTPHENAPEFVINTLIKSLQRYDKAYAIKNKMGFWIDPDHVKLLNCQSLAPKEPGRMENLPKDPLTGESLKEDSSLVVSCVVHLGTVKADDEEKKDEQSSSPPSSSRSRRNRHR
jgi:type IV pilus assembly protein PilM